MLSAEVQAQHQHYQHRLLPFFSIKLVSDLQIQKSTRLLSLCLTQRCCSGCSVVSCEATAMKSRKLLESCSYFHSSNQIPAFRRAHGSDEVLAASFIYSAKKHLHCFLLLGIGRTNSHRSNRCILFRRAMLSLVSVLLIYAVNISMQEIVCSVVLYIHISFDVYCNYFEQVGNTEQIGSAFSREYFCSSST